MNVAELIAKALIGRELESEGIKYHHPSTVHALTNGEVLCCFIASIAPNSRGARRNRHERIGFTYRGREISKTVAAELLKS